MTHQKALKTGIIASILLVAAILTMTTTTATNVQATSLEDLGRGIGKNLEDLGSDLDKANDGYQQGYIDGKGAGIDGDVKECPRHETWNPQSNDFSGYCIGFGAGFNRGEQSREDINENQNNNNDDDN